MARPFEARTYVLDMFMGTAGRTGAEVIVSVTGVEMTVFRTSTPCQLGWDCVR